MTLELERSQWKPFFDGLSRALENWDTNIHVLEENRGVTLLAERMPFHGLTLENVGGNELIGLSVGQLSDDTQMHNIFWPTRVAFAERGRGPAGTLDIEDAGGTTTLITFIEPHRIEREMGTSE
ncbi:MAG: DUF5335 family protein [Pyrinomonadaceae bacterium]